MYNSCADNQIDWIFLYHPALWFNIVMLKSDFHRVDENGSQQLSRYFGIAAAGFSLFLAKTVTIFRSIVLVMSRAAENFFFHFQRSRIHHKGFWDKRQLLKMSFHASEAAVSSLHTGLHFCQFFSILASFLHFVIDWASLMQLYCVIYNYISMCHSLYHLYISGLSIQL